MDDLQRYVERAKPFLDPGYIAGLGSTPNKELFRIVLDLVEEDEERLDMDYWGKIYGGPVPNDCGAVACFAGWLIILDNGGPEGIRRDYDIEKMWRKSFMGDRAHVDVGSLEVRDNSDSLGRRVSAGAATLLNIPQREAIRIFEPTLWRSTYKKDLTHLEGLRRLIEDYLAEGSSVLEPEDGPDPEPEDEPDEDLEQT